MKSCTAQPSAARFVQVANLAPHAHAAHAAHGAAIVAESKAILS